MQDTIIKGTGNSRTLGSIANFLTVYPTYEAFAQALMQKKLPIDLGGLADAGLNQRGTDLNKAALLKDATAALFGKDSTAVPDDILVAIRSLFTTTQNSIPKIVTGSYAGSGDVSTTTRRTIVIGFKPKLFVLAPTKGYQVNGLSCTSILIGVGDFIFAIGYYANSVVSVTGFGTFTSNGVELVNYHTTNQSGIDYKYIAIG